MAENGTGAPVLGIDLGGTKILAGVVGADNQILGRGKRPTPAQEGAASILRAITESVDEALATARLRRSDLAGGGVGSPGPLDAESGVIFYSANLNVRNFALGPDLSRMLDCPIRVENDVRVGGYGEFRLGAGRGYRDVIAVFVGTGIGGCVIMNGRVVTGSSGNAGEVGHLTIKAGGPRCGCGARGCLEALASKTAITRRVHKAIRKGQLTVLSEKLLRRAGRLKSSDLAEAVASGDRVALKEADRAAHFLGLGLGSLVNLLSPELIIVGGGVAGALGESWLELVRATARAKAIADPLGSVRIQRAALGDDAGIVGAALLARERFLPASIRPAALATNVSAGH